MHACLKTGFVVGFLLSLAFPSGAQDVPNDFVEVEVRGMTPDASGSSVALILVDAKGKKALPVWVGVVEAGAIERELTSAPAVRPMTHDLLYAILVRMKARVQKVRITELRENIYYASLHLKVEQALIDVDARPSDAIVLALKAKAPILVSARILNERGITLTQEGAPGVGHGMRVQPLTPSLASHFNFKGRKGVLVSEVAPGSSSDASAIRPGDIITRIGSREVGTMEEFEQALDALKDERSARVVIFRDGRWNEVELSLKP